MTTHAPPYPGARAVPLGGQLARGRVAWVDPADYDRVMTLRWHVVDQRHRIFRRLIAPPNHVLIGTRKEQLAWIERRGFFRLQIQYRHWDATVRRGRDQAADADLSIQSQ